MENADKKKAAAPKHSAAQGFKPLTPLQVRPTAKERKRGSAKVMGAVAGVVILAFVASCVYFWFNKPVNFNLNGKTEALKEGAPVSEAFADAGINPKPGKLVAVDGSTLDEKGGWAYSAKLNGKDLSDEEAAKLTIHEGDTIEIADGRDKTEDYEVLETVTTEPKLAMEGNAGVIGYIANWGKPGVTEKRHGKQSDKTVDVEVNKVENTLVKLAMIHPKDNEKLVALTFDDGPSEYSAKYLEILKKYNAKATFFEVGYMAEKHGDWTKALLDAGMQVANHSYSHKQLTAVDAATVQSELKGGFDALKTHAGVSTTTIRPPYGDFRQKTWLESAGLMSVSVLWTQDSEDWRRPGPDKIVSNSLVNIKPGSIILMHDGGGDRSQNLEALPKILQSLTDQGYKVVTVAELMASDPDIPTDIAKGDATMPEGTVWPKELA